MSQQDLVVQYAISKCKKPKRVFFYCTSCQWRLIDYFKRNEREEKWKRVAECSFLHPKPLYIPVVNEKKSLNGHDELCDAIGELPNEYDYQKYINRQSKAK